MYCARGRHVTAHLVTKGGIAKTPAAINSTIARVTEIVPDQMCASVRTVGQRMPVTSPFAHKTAPCMETALPPTYATALKVSRVKSVTLSSAQAIVPATEIV